MDDLSFDKSEFREAVADLVAPYQQQRVLDLIDAASGSRTFEETGLALLGETAAVGVVVPTKAGETRGARATPVWTCIKREVYDLFCTNSARYKSERKEGATSVKSLITIVATAVAAQFSLPVGIVTGAVAVCLMAALKVGLNGYCAAAKPSD